ncbi:MAG: CopD family protein, partial [Gemmatimonas sp.]
DMTRADLPTLLGETGWGQGWSQLMTACVLASIALVLPVGGSTSLMLVFGTLAVAFAMSGLGHAAADEQWPLGARVLDATHILTTGAWIGGLLMTWSVTCVRGFATANEAWRRFSRVATVMAPLSIATGVLGAARVLRHASLGAAVSSDYGQLLLLKTALVVTVLAIGARLRRRIARGDLPAVRSVQVELGMALGVLLVTALFTGMEPPGE